MRNVQRGIATSIVLILFLIIGIALASGYFIFSQNQQRLKSINSFEDCAKYYPVMESFPEQCNTPDGKHFSRKLSEEEKEKVIPKSSSADLETAGQPAKLTEKDGVVWSDVQQMAVLVNLFCLKNKRLPKDFTEVLADPENSNFKLSNNPFNGQPYVYKPYPENKYFEINGEQSDGSIYKQKVDADCSSQ